MIDMTSQVAQALLERAFPELEDLENATHDVLDMNQAFIDGANRVTGELTNLTTGDNALTGTFGDDVVNATGDIGKASAERVTEKLALEATEESFFGAIRNLAIDTAMRIIERAGLGAFVTVLDIIQGGLDIVTDIIGAVLDALVIQAIIDMVEEFIQIVQQHWQQWERELESLLQEVESDASRIFHNPPRMQTEQEKIDQLRKEFPSAADQAYINELLRQGFTADEIRAMLNAGLTLAQIVHLGETIGINKLRALEHDYPNDFGTLVHDLSLLLEQLRTRPNFATDPHYQHGINQMVDDLLQGGNKALGALYGLFWCVDPNNLPRIDYVEDTDANGYEAVDVVLIDGNVVELKSRAVFKYPPFLFQKELPELVRQAIRDLGLYPDGKTITFCFDTSLIPGPPYSKSVMENIKKVIEELEKQTAPGSSSHIKVDFWPPKAGLPPPLP